MDGYIHVKSLFGSIWSSGFSGDFLKLSQLELRMADAAMFVVFPLFVQAGVFSLALEFSCVLHILDLKFMDSFGFLHDILLFVHLFGLNSCFQDTRLCEDGKRGAVS